jgi:ferrochelatase
MSTLRNNQAQEIYKNIGGKSPIHEMTEKQRDALNNSLGENYKVFVAMRYWGVRAKQVVKELREENFEKVILLPLYPQFSSTTTGSSFDEWEREIKKEGINVATTRVGCYFNEPNFINSQVKLLTNAIEKAKNNGFSNPKIIFSAHGLPEKIIKRGDPYQFQVEETVKNIVKKFQQPEEMVELDHVISYQSRVGPVKWIGPYTDEVIVKYSKENRALIIVPVAFVSEHSETLVELDIEYKKLANDNNCPYYLRVETVMTEENFILSLTNIVKNLEKYSNSTHSWQGNRFCGPDKKECRCI